jgi:peroxiredoxin
MRSDNLYELPKNLQEPTDDGAARHLPGMVVPPVVLVSTSGRRVSLAEVSQHGRVVVYCYPRTGQPDKAPPPGWDDVPGARGCTPQSCGFRDIYSEFRALGAEVFGLSVQDTDYQRELVQRIHLPFEVLSDADHALTRVLRLPTFVIQGKPLLKRTTLVLHKGRIEKVFYPVFPPDKNARRVLEWLRANAAQPT